MIYPERLSLFRRNKCFIECLSVKKRKKHILKSIYFLGNSEVWDIRTFHLLKTVPELDQCLVKFTNNADIIYAITLEQETGKWIFYFLFFPLGL